MTQGLNRIITITGYSAGSVWRLTRWPVDYRTTDLFLKRGWCWLEASNGAAVPVPANSGELSTAVGIVLATLATDTDAYPDLRAVYWSGPKSGC